MKAPVGSQNIISRILNQISYHETRKHVTSIPFSNISNTTSDTYTNAVKISRSYGTQVNLEPDNTPRQTLTTLWKTCVDHSTQTDLGDTNLIISENKKIILKAVSMIKASTIYREIRDEEPITPKNSTACKIIRSKAWIIRGDGVWTGSCGFLLRRSDQANQFVNCKYSFNSFHYFIFSFSSYFFIAHHSSDAF